jgi:hypothetical protein
MPCQKVIVTGAALLTAWATAVAAGLAAAATVGATDVATTATVGATAATVALALVACGATWVGAVGAALEHATRTTAARIPTTFTEVRIVNSLQAQPFNL